MSTRVFIVEDELIHAEALKIAAEEAGLQLAGECGDADAAFNLISQAHPDVLLVDIALPGVNNGITLAARVHEELKIPHIFTTSFSQDDIIKQAVATHPSGYIRKPVDAVNLKAAVEIALQGNGTPPSPKQGPLENAPVFTRVGDKLVRIPTCDLLIIRADGENCISLIFEKKELACRTTLKEFCSQLPPSFVQVHRGYVINLDHIDALNEREQTLSLKGHTAPVGRSFRKEILDVIRRI